MSSVVFLFYGWSMLLADMVVDDVMGTSDGVRWCKVERELGRCSRRKAIDDPDHCKSVHTIKICMHVNEIAKKHIACTVTYHV